MNGRHKLYPEKHNFKKPCACGCGELIWDRNRNGPLTFKPHHSLKGLWWFDGKRHTTQGKKRPDASLRMKLHNPMARSEIKASTLHFHIKTRLPKPSLCESCKDKPPHDLANVSGKYLEDLSDWEWLCRRCHMRTDGRLSNLMRGKHKPKAVVVTGV